MIISLRKCKNHNIKDGRTTLLLSAIWLALSYMSMPVYSQTPPPLTTPPATEPVNPNTEKKEIKDVNFTWRGAGAGCPKPTKEKECEILYSKSKKYPVPHEVATEGKGTYDDPITLAAHGKPFPPGTFVYVPWFKKYFVFEDDCPGCVADTYVEGFMGPKKTNSGINRQLLLNCARKWSTAPTNPDNPKITIIINPEKTLEVDQEVMLNPDGSCKGGDSSDGLLPSPLATPGGAGGGGCGGHGGGGGGGGGDGTGGGGGGGGGFGQGPNNPTCTSSTTWDQVDTPAISHRDGSFSGISDGQGTDFLQQGSKAAVHSLYAAPCEVPSVPSISWTVFDLGGNTAGLAYPGQGKIELDSAMHDANTAKMVSFHEATHLYQYWGDASQGATEGLADTTPILAGLTPMSRRTAGGNWDDAYETTAFFLIWIQQTKGLTNFLHDFNQQNAPGKGGWSWESAIMNTTGKSVQSLWDEYQASLR
ncbi:MAG: basic secretory protein-like protein [Pseudomonadota bacterium]